MNAIIANELTKKFGHKLALRDFNIEISQGTKMALIGSENCGKTTALRLFAGMCAPTSGACSVLGYSPTEEPHKIHNICGVMTDTARLYETMTVMQNLKFFADMNAWDPNDTLDRSSLLLHKLGIWEERDKKIHEISTSAKQRVNMARALMHSPKILLMDEPTSGLDRETTAVLGDLLNHLVEVEGTTVLICTRHLEHAELLCDRFGIMADGELLACGDMDSLRRGAHIRYKAALYLSEISNTPQVKDVYFKDGCWYKEITGQEEMPGIIKQAVNDGCELYEAKIIKPKLRDIYEAYLNGDHKKVATEEGENDADYDVFSEYPGFEQEQQPEIPEEGWQEWEDENDSEREE